MPLTPPIYQCTTTMNFLSGPMSRAASLPIARTGRPTQSPFPHPLFPKGSLAVKIRNLSACFPFCLKNLDQCHGCDDILPPPTRPQLGLRLKERGMRHLLLLLPPGHFRARASHFSSFLLSNPQPKPPPRTFIRELPPSPLLLILASGAICIPLAPARKGCGKTFHRVA